MNLRWMIIGLLNAVAGISLRGAVMEEFPDLDGVWFQPLASRFVVDSRQIDQKCITWEIVSDRKTVNASVHSLLHSVSGDENTNHYIYQRHRDGQDWILDGRATESLWIRKYTPNYALLMGFDNMTFFAIVRDMHEYQMIDKDMILRQLTVWEYTSYDKTPVITYGSDC